jgi:triosephosphate isomerase
LLLAVQVATPEQAQDVHAYIRKWLAEHVSPQVAGATRIIYGAAAAGGYCCGAHAGCEAT